MDTKKYIEEKKTIVKKLEVLPCVKCGSNDIEIYNCGYSSFNVAGGKCKNCGNEAKSGFDWNASESSIAKYWNRENNPDILRKRFQKQIDDIQKQIDQLP